MNDLSHLVRRILEAAFDGAATVDSLETFKESYEHNSDGTDLLMVSDHISHLSLADDFIAENGKEAFVQILNRHGDISSAIYEAANITACQRGVDASFAIIDQIITSTEIVKAPKGFKIKNVRILNGTSALDHFPPKSVIGNCEQYRNIEGSGNYDLYRSVAKVDQATFKYTIEVSLEEVK